MNTIPAIEEVNIFKDDHVIQFLNPKGKIIDKVDSLPLSEIFNTQLFYSCYFPPLSVQASIAANTWAVSGSPQTKSTFLTYFPTENIEDI